MAKIKGNIDKIPKKKMFEVKEHLKRMYERKEICQLQRCFLKHKFHKYKKLYEENLACDKSNISFEEGNAWGYRDNKHLMKEKNDKIFQLEKKIEEMKKLNRDIIEKQEKNETVKKVKVEDTGVKNINVVMSDQLRFLFDKIKTLEENHYAEIKEFEEDYEVMEEKLKELKSKLQEEELKQKPEKENIEIDNKDTLFYLEMMHKAQNEAMLFMNRIRQMEGLIHIAKKECAHTKQEKDEIMKTIEIMEERIKKCNENYDKLNGKDEYMVEEIKAVSEAFDSLSNENKELHAKIEMLNKKNRGWEEKLLENQIKAKGADKTLELIEEQEKKLVEYNTKLKQEKENHIKEYGPIEEELRSTKEQNDKLMQTLKVYKRDIVESQTVADKKAKKYYEQINQLKDMKIKDVEKEEKIVKLQATIDAYEQSFRENKTTADLYMQIQDLKEYIYCALCKSNIKSHVINGCMHCFCEECLDHRLKTRTRNCPKCNKEYAKTDIKKIYF